LGSVIAGTGIHLPGRIVTNDDLARVMDVSDDWIRSRSGVGQRRVAEPGVGASQLGAQAGLAALDDAGLTAGDIDALVTATMTPDLFAPGIAPMVQKAMGLPRIPAHDLRAQCCGFLYGLDLADALIGSGRAATVLVVGAEVHAGYFPWGANRAYLYGESDRPPTRDEWEHNTRNRSWSVLFGDGAGAMVLRRGDDPRSGLLGSRLWTDGEMVELIHVPGVGFRHQPWVDHAQLDAELHMPVMDGRGLFRNAVTLMTEAIRAVLADHSLDVADLDLLIAHQANARIIEAMGKTLGIDPVLVPINIDRYGNTTAATLPILFHEMRQEGRVPPGALVCLSSFGAGAHWGAALYRVPPDGTPSPDAATP
jgi:3-oxoacyl-[acyl-carrier-protein] synthase III